MVSIFRKLQNYLFDKVYFVVNQGTLVNKSSYRKFNNIYVSKGATLIIGEYTILGEYTYISTHNKIDIGNGIMIAPNCFISDGQHNYKLTMRDRYKDIIKKPCTIEDGAWIGYGSVIISSNIGKNSVVGANSTLINFDIPDNHLFIGDSRLDKQNYKLIRIG
jgi:acetyltransferase-like isoleucine patch superfamily enzyme